MIVADVKTDAARGLPSWNEPERSQAVANLKVSMEFFTVETSLSTPYAKFGALSFLQQIKI